VCKYIYIYKYKYIHINIYRSIDLYIYLLFGVVTSGGRVAARRCAARGASKAANSEVVVIDAVREEHRERQWGWVRRLALNPRRWVGGLRLTPPRVHPAG